MHSKKSTSAPVAWRRRFAAILAEDRWICGGAGVGLERGIADEKVWLEREKE
jgi:hypothetical protein